MLVQRTLWTTIDIGEAADETVGRTHNLVKSWLFCSISLQTVYWHALKLPITENYALISGTVCQAPAVWSRSSQKTPLPPAVVASLGYC